LPVVALSLRVLLPALQLLVLTIHHATSTPLRLMLLIQHMLIQTMQLARHMAHCPTIADKHTQSQETAMNQTLRLVLLMCVMIPGGSVLADTATQAPAEAPPPIPTLLCDFKSMSLCAVGKPCVADEKIAGMSLPLKVTVDFENSTVGSVDEAGYARVDKFDTVAKSANQLIIHGIDGAFGWQLTIHDNSDAASLSLATVDTSLIGFGSCRNK
jgi:hypothetical protein